MASFAAARLTNRTMSFRIGARLLAVSFNRAQTCSHSAFVHELISRSYPTGSSR